ncbi:MFS transporter [Amnibacterium kyonggiense]|uniref:DHA1 family L-arabinose/isopropyl-beta-D-thiogalactopyranoside export protein-like MFS transporter/DHA1 family inner membrane transport protein n=1 Tax=Amnibacterium kyonggiense TaxID=595671 RepID=A0A4R7FQM7_9MICO|nr:MFS transporter [Amnibacterium kyonggiense]TDS80091.1 DHA1 family L-arabinose/isopropyl-beta-D-thiogalactopyranoside export protein-like MFS transporter/DHA1 family inner membrane transport protein [Amnibacterium kyonggiense]
MTAEARRRALALGALAIATFTYVTTETLPIGVLPGIARAFSVDAATVGLLVGAYALVVVVATVPLARLTARVPRRAQLLLLLGLLVVANLGSALAPAFGVLVAARVIAALSHALFWAVVGPTAASLARPGARGRALAAVFAGQSIGVVVGVPLGTLIGEAVDWRAAFGGAAVLAAVALAVAAAALPRVARAEDLAATGSEPSGPRYAVLVAATVLVATGSLLAFTYVTPFLIDVSRVSPGAVSAVLLVRGAAGLLAVLVSGRFIDRHPRRVMLAATALLVVGLLVQWAGREQPLVATVGLALIAGGMSAFTTGLSTRVLTVAPGSTDVAAGGTSTAFNVGIMAGSSAGGALLAVVGLAGLPLVGAVFAAAALLLLAVEPPLVRARVPA